MITVSESVPLHGTSTEDVVESVRKVMKKAGVVSFHVNAADGTISFKRIATEEEEAAAEKMSYHDIVRSRPMEEYIPPNGSTAYTQLFEMFEVIEDAGFVPTVLLSGRPLHELRKWLGKMSRKAKSVYGIKVLVEDSLPDDNLILCASESTDTRPDAVQFSVKMSLP